MVATIYRKSDLGGKEGLEHVRSGKTRDIYRRAEKQGLLYVVATDRISAYDHLFDQGIPDKGRLLTRTSAHNFVATKNVVGNHFIDSPDDNVIVVHEVKERFPIEVIVRGFIAGSLWKRYHKEGERKMYNMEFPEGLKANQELDDPIVTTTTKAEVGHDMPIDTDENIAKLIAKVMGMTQGESMKKYQELKETAIELYVKGDEQAKKNGGREADSKYEFGILNGKIILIDELNNQDSSRFMLEDDYQRAFKEGREPEWHDKQTVRVWLRDVAKWEGDEHGPAPVLPQELIDKTVRLYTNAHRIITGRDAPELKEQPSDERILKNLRGW